MRMTKQALRFDLDQTLRTLGRWLVEHEGLPPRYSESPLKPGGLLSREEHSFLFWLAVGHLNRHAPVAPDARDPAPCPQKDAPCRAAGVARAIIDGCDALRDRKEIPHVGDLRRAFGEAAPALKKLIDALDDYRESCAILHRQRWNKIPARAQKPRSRVVIHAHAFVCELPDDLRDKVVRFGRLLRLVDAVSLAPQYASKATAAAFAPGRRPRPLLIAQMQADLALDGWELDEIAGMTGDGQKGEPGQIRDRIRKRIAPWVPRQKPKRQ
jgi:hypothetical protein